MTSTEIATKLLLYFAPEERSIPDAVAYPGRNAEVLDAINGALEEIHGDGPWWMQWRLKGARLKAPTTVSIGVTAGSKTATIASGSYQSWMLGQFTLIAGQAEQNRILAATLSGGNYNISLLHEWDGTTGTVSATIYNDTVLLDSDTIQVATIRHTGGNPLIPIEQVLQGEGRLNEDDFSLWPNPVTLGIEIGTPDRYMVVAGESVSTDEALRQRLRVWPVPSAETSLEWQEKVGPQVLSAIDSTKVRVAANFAKAILIPVATQRLTASPFFRAPEAMVEIGRQFKVAKDMLRKLKAQATGQTRMVPRY